jgi:peptidoglycan/xylan/chitin deacetylase (PgdA/CDA1 family)
MADLKRQVFQTALTVLHATRVCHLLAPLTRGRGVIFMLHQVGPNAGHSFNPNGILNITPDFLETVITYVHSQGYDIIALDDVPERLASEDADKPFACFTLDDGYRDNIENAYPVFKRHNVPFTIYLPTDYLDGKGDLWWLALEEAIRRAPSISLSIDGKARTFDCQTVAHKSKAFQEIYWWLRPQPEDQLRRTVSDIVAQSGYDASTLCSDLVMTWDEARQIANDPLVTFGGHTRRHMALAKLPVLEARRDVLQGAKRLERELNLPCHHFAYPYGDEASANERDFELLSKLGFRTAVTTQKGVLYPADAKALTALPRLSLNGDYQSIKYVAVLMTGVPFAIWNMVSRLRRVFQRLSSASPSTAPETNPSPAQPSNYAP